MSPRTGKFRRAGLRHVVALTLLAMVAAPAGAAGGSYASGGVGKFVQSLWWLDFTGFNIGSTSTQSMSFALPDGDTLTLGAKISSVTNANGGGWILSTEPAWSGGGSFGHGAYNGIAGSPIFYICCGGSPATATVTLSSITVKDKANNARNFYLYAADGENTNSPENITYTSTAAWTEVDAINPYNGGIPALAGLGSTSVVESAPSTNDQSLNGSIVLQTLNPTQVATQLVGNEAVLYGVAMPPITFNVNVAGRINAADQFIATTAYTSPTTGLGTVTTSGASATTGVVSVLAGNTIALGVTMSPGSVSALTNYVGSMSCANSGTARTVGATVLPSGTGTAFTISPQIGDRITCTLTLTPPATPTLQPNGAKTSQAGAEVIYAHTFQAGTAGNVVFSASAVSTPAAPVWTQELYQDTNCNGAIDAGEPLLTGAAMAVTPGQKICVIAAVFVPSGSSPGAVSTLTVSAAFTSAIAVLNATVTATDTTTVAAPSALVLTKLVADVSTSGTSGVADNASPGDTLQYTLTASNNGTQSLANVVVDDVTPAFTTFVSTTCPGVLPPSITGCAVSAAPAAGAAGSLQWTFTGSLPSGSALVITYRVKIGS